MTVQVKICGITRQEDAEKAISLGASALGFILAPSPRQISLAAAEAIAAALPAHILRFAVLQDPTFEEAARAIASGALNAVQLHGREPFPFVRHLKDRFPRLFLLKRIRPEDPVPAGDFPGDAILLEPAGQPGPLRAEQIPAGPFPKPLFLAGKISAADVFSLVQSARPAGVDICGALEESAGVKDHGKMERFFAALRGEHA